MDNTSDVDKPISTLQQAGFDTKANASAVSNVDNTSDLGKPVSTAQQTALDLKANNTAISNMDNTSDVDKPISTLQQAGFDTKANASAVSNVDNTSDLGKPVSTAQQTALDLKADIDAQAYTGAMSFTGTLNNITTTEFGYLDGVTSNIQTQISNNDTDISTINSTLTGYDTYIETDKMKAINKYGSNSINESPATNKYNKICHIYGSQGAKISMKILSGNSYNNHPNVIAETSNITYVNIMIANNLFTAEQNIKFNWWTTGDDTREITKLAFYETAEWEYDCYVFCVTDNMNMSYFCDITDTTCYATPYATIVQSDTVPAGSYEQTSETSLLYCNNIIYDGNDLDAVIDTKADIDAQAHTGAMSFTGTLNNITTTEFGYLDNLSGNIETEFLQKDATSTASVSLFDSLDTSGILTLGNDSDNNYIKVAKTSQRDITIKSDNVEILGRFQCPQAVCGVFIIDGSKTDFTIFPIYFSTNNLNKINSKKNSGTSLESGSYPASNTDTTGPVGTYDELDCDNSDDYYLVLPGYGVVAYADLSYAGTVKLAYENHTASAQIVKTVTTNVASSVKIYFDNVEIT